MEVMQEPSDTSKKILNTIDKYQAVYRNDPESKIFAPLAEAHRKAGNLEHAFEIAKKGTEDHPEFASGLVTFSRILIDMNERDKAIVHLKMATEMSPDNFLAHKLLGETYINLKLPVKALQVFKMALYLDPMDEFAKKMVKKLESLSASEFEDESLFNLSEPSLNPSNFKKPSQYSPLKTSSHELDRYISLVDAYISRNDYLKASNTVIEALDKFDKNPELQRRKIFLSQRFEDSSQKLSEIDTDANRHLEILNLLLTRVENRRLY